eukprot:COSAG02_NODE_11836_length_1644_cov_19.200647_2_plen_200_part_00
MGRPGQATGQSGTLLIVGTCGEGRRPVGVRQAGCRLGAQNPPSRAAVPLKEQLEHRVAGLDGLGASRLWFEWSAERVIPLFIIASIEWVGRGSCEISRSSSPGCGGTLGRGCCRQPDDRRQGISNQSIIIIIIIIISSASMTAVTTVVAARLRIASSGAALPTCYMSHTVCVLTLQREWEGAAGRRQRLHACQIAWDVT